MIHKSPACKNQRLRIFGYLWQWWTFYQWHLPSCPGCFLSTGAFLPSPLTWTSCPSINISPLFWQMPVEEQWNVTRFGFVCVYFVPVQSGLAQCNQCCPSALFNGLQVMMCRCQTWRVWGQGSLILVLVMPHDLMALGVLSPRSQLREKTSHCSAHYKCKHMLLRAGALTELSDPS